LGVKTTAVEMSERLLPLADFELVKILRSEMESDGIRILTGTRAAQVVKGSGNVVLNYEDQDGGLGTLESDSLLVALGRVPDYGHLALEKAGVKYGNRGIFTDRKLRTSVPNIYACGDIVGPDQLAAMAEYQGILAATNIFSPLKASIDYANKIYVIFTDPVLAYFGLTEAQAHQKYGHNLSVYRFDYSNMRRALIDGCRVGLGKFLCNKQGKLVGAHILGESAAEVIHEAQLIRAFNKPLHKVNAITHAYPTYSQALVGRAGQLAYLDKMSSNAFVQTALKILPGFANNLHSARERLAEEEKESADKYLQPSRDQLPLKSTYAGNNSCFICMPKYLTHHDEDHYLRICSKLETKGRKFVVLDFSIMEEINAFGVDMLIKLSAQLARKKIKLIAFGVNDYLKQIFVSTELYKILESFQTTRQIFDEIGLEPDHSLLCNSDTQFRNTKYWAKPVYLLQVPPMPREANNLNVDGRRTESPVSGFGQLWEKIYRLKIDKNQASAKDVITAFKKNFINFQPPFNRFYATAAGIAPGEIVLINSMTPGGPVATGVMIVHCDDNSFTFITPQGHPECGLVSFSAHEENGHTIAQILGLARASDPIFEAAFRMVGSKIQVRIWNHVLTSLALHLGVRPDISVQQRCVDPKLNWSKMFNARYNAQILTLMNEPFRWFGK
jgi:anti-anti-sigma regulatory factor